MNKDFTDKTNNKEVTPDNFTEPAFCSDNQLLFQIFFLSEDQGQNVEIVETTNLDFGEITQRLKSGESVFIKNKDQEALEAQLRTNKQQKHKSWYFTHC